MDSFPPSSTSSPPHGGSPAAAPPLPLIVLTPEELVSAPHEVLVSLVARLQDEHARVNERVEHLEGEVLEERDERRRIEKEAEGAKGRVDELLADQGRMDEELGGRIEVLEKLRGTIRTLEREKRDVVKRYREQSETFESERQAWYDQEQHYKLRLSNLTSGSRRSGRMPAPTAHDHVEEGGTGPSDGEDPPETPRADPASLSRSSSSSPAPSASSTRSGTPSTSATSDSTTSPTAAELSLRAQLDTLTTAHSSLSSTLHKLQNEMADLKRVYQDVQEQNESYEILLGEKTLSGEVRSTALFRQSFSWGESGLGDDHAAPGEVSYGGAFGFSGGLDPVGEEEELPLSSDEHDTDSGPDDDEDGDEIERVLLESKGTGSPHSGAVAAERAERRRSRRAAKRASVAGPAGGLDLAAELEAAAVQDEQDEGVAERLRTKAERREKRREEKRLKRKASASQMQRAGSLAGLTESELQHEVMQLREANKALALYLDKIVDRVCSQEGFEKVLAIDYRNTPKPNAPTSPETPGPPLPDKKPRPASIGFFRSTATPTTAASTPVRRVEPSTPLSTASFVTAPSATPTSPTGPRKSGGGVWDSVASVFSLSRSTSSAAPPSPAPTGGMKPLMLADPAARKVEFGDEFEDDEDRRERERIRAEMVQLGFDPPPASRLAAGASPRPASSTSPLPSPSLGGGRSPGESSLRDSERARALEALERQDAARGATLTEMPQRRMSLLGQRKNSARTNSELGLGIEGAPLPAIPATEDEAQPATGAGAESGPRKALRRLSAAWSSPPVGS